MKLRQRKTVERKLQAGEIEYKNGRFVHCDDNEKEYDVGAAGKDEDSDYDDEDVEDVDDDGEEMTEAELKEFKRRAKDLGFTEKQINSQIEEMKQKAASK